MEVEIHDYCAEPNDLYLLCSDGLSDMLAAKEINRILENDWSSLNAVCNMLVRQANDNGGRDNILVILIGVHEHGTEDEGLFGRTLCWVK
jgi:protein phosphatase